MKYMIYPLLIMSVYSFAAPSAVVNELEGGRLGDKLLTYARAYWVAWKHGLELYVKPFPHIDKLHLWYVHQRFRGNNPPLKVSKRMTNLQGFSPNASTLYRISYYFFLPGWEYDVTTWNGLIDNSEFRSLLRTAIAPHYPLTLPTLPKRRITVAMHVRRGGGFDAPLLSKRVENELEGGKDETMSMITKKPHKHKNYADRGAPLKFPPLSFYVDSLKVLAHEYKGRRLYAYIFTDDPNPLALQRYFERELKGYKVQFACRTEGNHHTKNVIDDMFDMARYTCLIRPASSYSQTAQLIGDHAVVMYPYEAQWQDSILKITKIMHASDNIRTCIDISLGI